MSIVPLNKGTGTGNNAYRTLWWFFNELQRRAGITFDLDPCSYWVNAKCKYFYTKRRNGLAMPWHKTKKRFERRWHKVNAVYCNPPFDKIGPWAKKAYETWRDYGTTVVMLIPASTCTEYFHEYLNRGEIFFMRRRLAFGNPATGEEMRENPSSMLVVVFSNQHLPIGDEFATLDLAEWKKTALDTHTA